MEPFKCETHLGSIKSRSYNKFLAIPNKEVELPRSFYAKLPAGSNMVHKVAALAKFQV
jgi:hypothetical protein